MGNHKLHIDDFEDLEYSLIAIHTNLENFRLGFFINKILNLELRKNEIEISIYIKDGKTSFASLVYDDEIKAIYWNLLENKNEVIVNKTNPMIDLFSENKIKTIKKVYLLPEFKKVDYFLKINHSGAIDEQEIISKLQTIDRISTIYNVDIDTIKNKNNLIF